MKKVFKYIGYCFCFILPVILMLVVIEYKPVVVLSGSMEPVLSVDDLAFIKKVDDIKLGDIVAFTDKSGDRILHRVIEINEDTVITKGDANNVSDKAIQKSKINGVYIFKIKYVGKILKFIKAPIGLLICLVLVFVILFFPKKREEDSGDKKHTRMKIMVFGVLYIILLIVCIVMGYYSKYQSSFSGSDEAVVANWNNNIELIGEDTFYFQNGKSDSNLIKFNLKSQSEVSAYYNVSVNNISKVLGSELSGDEGKVSIKQQNDSFVVGFNSVTQTFLINTIKTNGSVVLNGITATYEVIDTNDVYKFKDSSSKKEVDVVVNGDKFNLEFVNFGKFQINDLSIKECSLLVTAVNTELPNLDNLELYATFEQID